MLKESTASDRDEIYAQLSGLQKESIEIAGRGFFDLYERPLVVESRRDQLLSGENSPNNRGDQDISGEDDSPKIRDEKKARTKAGMFKIDDNLKNVDLYKLLDVEPDSSINDIKKGYRNLCLVYHPDKVAGSGDEEAKNKEFIRIQEAFDILTDPIRRRKYDSTRPFDDDIPKESDVAEIEHDEDFFESFAHVFKRNSKWSTKQPVPQLPAFSTELKIAVPEDCEKSDKHKAYMKTVMDFYKFWTGDFDSWRDFDAKIIEEEGDDALEDSSKADGREEKRYIEKQNARIRQKYRNKESARILALAELAEKYDTRMKNHRQLQWNKKYAGKKKKRGRKSSESRSGSKS